MKVVALSCPQCGGTQEVPAQDEFLVCTYCQVRLKVTRDDKGWLMKLLDETQRENRKLEAENDVLRLEKAIQDLNRKWEALRETMLIGTKQGTREPIEAWGWVQVIAAVGVPLIFWVSDVFGSRDTQYCVIATMVGGFFVLSGWSEISNGREFDRCEDRYERRKAELHHALAKARTTLLDLSKLASVMATPEAPIR